MSKEERMLEAAPEMYELLRAVANVKDGGDKLRYAIHALLSRIDGEDLKPCPFCGSEVSMISRDDFDEFTEGTPEFYAVFCDNCNASAGEFATREEAVKTWNTRAES